MEGAGSRLSRASSRYGPATTVFSGPVRRWKKRWVHVPPSPSSVSSRSQSNGRNNDNTSRLLLCRWTPISPTTNSATAEPNSAGATEEPPRRKFRYTPVAVLEEQKKTVEKKVEDMEDVENTSDADQSPELSDQMYGKSNTDQVEKQETEELVKNQSGSQASSVSNLNLDLGLQGHSTNLDLMNKMKEAQMKTASSGGFWLR